MAYHKDFWVVVGTAAPVIAVAAVIAYNQSAANWGRARERPGAGTPSGHIVARRAMVTTHTVAIAIGLELIGLVFALMSLAGEADWIGVAAGIITTIGGFLLLLVGGLTAFVLSEKLRRDEDAVGLVKSAGRERG